MVNKRLINTGVEAAPAAFDPLQNFEIVTYTGNGGTQKITGYIRKGGAFNGSSSHIDIPSPIPYTNTDLSFSCWFNLSSAFSSSYKTIIGAGDKSTGEGIIRLLLRYDSANNYKIEPVRAYSGNSYYTDSSNYPAQTINAGSWYNIVYTYSASGNTAKIYINGSLVSTTSLTTTSTDSTNSGVLALGQYRDGASSATFWNGKIDQVRIFNKALSSSEVTTLYGETYASSTKSTTDIFGDDSGVALYELDEDANDTGGVSGKFGGGATFSSTSVSKVNTGIGSLATNFSVFMWVKIQDISVANSFFGNWNATTADDIYLSHNTDGQLRLGIDGVSNEFFGANGDITENTWHHVGFTFNNGTVTAYIDGSSKGTTTTSNTDFSSGQNFAIGSYTSRTNVNGSDVTIDDVRIYSDVLTLQEVGYLYNNTTASIPTDNLTAYYKFEGNSNDEQGNYNGTDSNVTYAYNGTPTNVNFLGMAFQPDLVWIKNRDSSGENHHLTDIVSGFGKVLFSNLTNAQVGSDDTYYTENSNGFSINTTNNNINNNDYVAWCWKAGGSAVSNTDGSITSTVSANPDAGFSIVKYTGNAGSTQTIGHGLSSAPEMIIIKNISDGAQHWSVYHSATGNGQVGHLNLSNAFSASGDWGSTTPTSTVFTIGSGDARTNSNGEDHIAYCFTSITGYQKIGSYTGTGSAVTVTTGFRPRWMMIKRYDSTGGNWYIYDQLRDGTNDRQLFANSSNQESTTGDVITYNSDGFTVAASGSGVNASGSNYIYLAIA